MPSHFFPERPGNERGRDDSAIDEDVINLKRVRAAIVAGWVKPPDLAGKISFETTDPAEQTSERDEKRDVKCHQKMAERHERGADRDCKSATKPTVGDQTAHDRREINKTGVETKDRRSKRLNIERPAKTLDEMAEPTKAGDMLDVRRMEQTVDHVKNQQCLHAVVGETFPRFGESDVGEAARVADETAVLRIVHAGSKK